MPEKQFITGIPGVKIHDIFEEAGERPDPTASVAHRGVPKEPTATLSGIG
jgi:hypothetical protein